MSELEYLCAAHTTLSDEDISRLRAVEENLPLIADLTNADIFLDCLVDETTALVVAQQSPAGGLSVYQQKIVGQYARKENEPAVFHAFEMGTPICDLKAITQENRAVRQNVAPIRNKEHRVIGVIVREKDISADLQQQRKYEHLAKSHEEQDPLTKSVDIEREEHLLAIREMHHRVKNNLQLVASILNLQARNSEQEQVREILKESVGRVLSIAAIHDILISDTEQMKVVSSHVLLEQLLSNLRMLVSPDKRIELSFSGDQIELASDSATSVSLVVTELVTNAIRHAFSGRDSGTVEVSVRRGEMYHTVCVKDDGTGFANVSESERHLGLSMVDAIVRDKLRGRFWSFSDDGGSQFSFEFRT